MSVLQPHPAEPEHTRRAATAAPDNTKVPRAHTVDMTRRPIPLREQGGVSQPLSLENVLDIGLWATTRQTLSGLWNELRQRAPEAGHAIRAVGLGNVLGTLLMHLPVIMISMTLYMMHALLLGTAHDAGYAVSAYVVSVGLAVLLDPIVVRWLGTRTAMGSSAFNNMVAVSYLLYVVSKLERDPTQVGTFEMAISIIAVGISTPVWATLNHERKYGASNIRMNDRQLFGMAVIANSVNLAVYPLAVGLIYCAQQIALSVGGVPAQNFLAIYGGLIAVLLLDLTMVLTSVFSPSKVPDSAPSTVPAYRRSLLSSSTIAGQKKLLSEAPSGAMPGDTSVHLLLEDQELQEQAQRFALVVSLGLGLLGICLGAIASGTLSYTMTNNMVREFPQLMFIIAAAAWVAAIPVLLTNMRLTPWVGWVLSAMGLIGTSLMLPTTQDYLKMALFLGLYGAMLGIAAAGHLQTLSRLDMVLPHANIFIFAGFIAAVGVPVGSMWGGYLGDSSYHSNAFMVPVWASCAYLLLGHVFGYLWRSFYEPHLEPLEPED